jgi:cytochrome c oxidase subunit 1
MVSSLGSYLTVIGTVLFFIGIVHAFRGRRAAGDNPWGVGATTLEWSLTSPPPFHCYETLPRIR